MVDWLELLAFLALDGQPVQAWMFDFDAGMEHSACSEVLPDFHLKLIVAWI